MSRNFGIPRHRDDYGTRMRLSLPLVLIAAILVIIFALAVSHA